MYSSILKKAVAENVFRQSGVEEGDIVTHNIQKRMATHAASGCDVSAISNCMR
jgi:hypothetical protein